LIPNAVFGISRNATPESLSKDKSLPLSKPTQRVLLTTFAQVAHPSNGKRINNAS